MSPSSSRLPSSARTLSRAAVAWFLAASFGQLAFVAYIVAFHLPPVLRGDFPALNDKPHITGWVPGDALGNAQLLLHVFVAAAVTLAGLLQLLPGLRRRWPAVHRWNGRFFLSAALVATLGGLYLTWVRGSRLDAASALAITANGVLILLFAGLAWRSARRRDFAAHRRHALRAFLLVNGVWFLRIGMMLAGVIAAPLGYELGYDDAVFTGLGFASWIVPLAVVELYFSAERSPRPGWRCAVAALIGLLAVATAAGSAAALAFMWWPRM